VGDEKQGFFVMEVTKTQTFSSALQMPRGNERDTPSAEILPRPVKAKLRKLIGKEAGASVHVRIDEQIGSVKRRSGRVP
jgi:hypothetical protein